MVIRGIVYYCYTMLYQHYCIPIPHLSPGLRTLRCACVLVWTLADLAPRNAAAPGGSAPGTMLRLSVSEWDSCEK